MGLEQHHSPLALIPQFQMGMDLAALPPSSPISPVSPLTPMAPPSPLFMSSPSYIGWGFPTTDDKHLGRVQLMRNELLIAIGNQAATASNNAGCWQCQFCPKDDWATRGSASTCLERFATPDDIIDHFSKIHHPIELPDQPIWYKCRLCGRGSNDYQYCQHCGTVDSGSQEQWIHGYAVGVGPALLAQGCEYY